jgi:hypothetical protein
MNGNELNVGLVNEPDSDHQGLSEIGGTKMELNMANGVNQDGEALTKLVAHETDHIAGGDEQSAEQAEARAEQLDAQQTGRSGSRRRSAAKRGR